MENLIVASKLKKLNKEKFEVSTSATFFEPLNKDILNEVDSAIEHAQKLNRKTVMGKDFNFYIEEPNIKEVLVVASKLKKYIKDKSGLSTSSQCVIQLTTRVEKICALSSEKAKSDKRKTVMDRDFSCPTAL